MIVSEMTDEVKNLIENEIDRKDDQIEVDDIEREKQLKEIVDCWYIDEDKAKYNCWWEEQNMKIFLLLINDQFIGIEMMVPFIVNPKGKRVYQWLDPMQ